MNALTGIAAIGSYDAGDSATDLAELKALIPDPDTTDTSGAQGGGGNLDEMSPIAAAQLRQEIDTMLGAFAYGTYTAVADDDTAGLVDIDTGLGAAMVDAQWGITIWRSGSVVLSDQVLSDEGSGVIRVADGAMNYDVTAGDIFVWSAYL